MDLLSVALGSAASFALVRRHKRQYLQIGIKDGIVAQMSSSTVHGVGVRCLRDGSWGFACSTNLHDCNILVEKALKAARVSAAKKSRQCTLAPSAAQGAWASPVTEPVTDEAIEEIISFIKEADTVVKDYPEIVSRQISFLSTLDEKEIATSEGTYITQREYRVFCTAAVTARLRGRRATSNNAVGGQVGKEFLAKDDLGTMVKEECERAVRVSAAHMPPAGKCTAVLSPEVASVLVHEAVGHTAEADVVSGGSYLSGKVGEKVATPYITLIDDGQYTQGFGTYGFDDEGVESQKTHIIEKGFLNHYLHSRETAYNLESPTGNARCWLYSREPLIRMTNTYLEPQSYTVEELIQEAGTGLFLKGVTHGLADHFGNFTLYVPEAQKIDRGVLENTYYSGVTVSANAFDVLSQVVAVGNPSTFKMIPGVCGKGETAFVGMGAPALMVSLTVGGEVS